MSELPSLAKLSLREEPTEAARGGRKEYMQGAQFDAARAYKLTASLLPKWCGVAKQPETRKKIIKNLLKNDGVYRVELNDFNRAAINYGVLNEPLALRAYQEVTRMRLNLGSTRSRGQLGAAAAANAEDARFSRLLVSTTDAFVSDFAERGNREGLLEAQCPYDANYNDFRVLRRMDHPGLLLQAWAQLEVSHEAHFIDLVKWQRQTPPKGPIGTCIWLARLYADKDMMQAVKDIVRQTLAPFEAAMQLLQRQPPPTDADVDVLVQDIVQAHGGRGRLTTPLKAALQTWADSCLKYMHMQDKVWMTERDALAKGQGADRFLARRYHPFTGTVYGWDVGADSSFSTGVFAHDLFRTEYGGETYGERRHKCAPDPDDSDATDIDDDDAPPRRPRPKSPPRPDSPGTPELYEPQTKRKRRGLIDPDKLPGGRRTEWSSDEDNES